MKQNTKRKHRLNYLVRKMPYELSELLDKKYWKTHEMWFRSSPSAINQQIKENCDIRDCQVVDGATTILTHRFLKLSGDQKNPTTNLFWVNDVDQANPYETGYDSKNWVVSFNSSIIVIVRRLKRHCK